MAEASSESVHSWLVLTKAAHAIGQRLRQQLHSAGLAETDFRILEALLHKGPLPVNGIGPKVYLNPGSVSVAVDRLHERGLVSRQESCEDRRVRTVALTQQGRQIIQHAFAQHAALLQELFAPLTAHEQRQLQLFLKRVGKGAEHDASGSQEQP